ncbi:MAG: ABC transporter permease [Clostridia bacterium]|nr:ABC transporter permease [Clostridia bacterium]
MSNEIKKTHEPLFHVAKRDSLSPLKGLLIRVIAIVVAILLCSILTFFLIGTKNPFSLISTLVDGSFGSELRIWRFAKDLAVMLCISLAVTPAFRMKFWNIGAEGQVLIGTLASISCAFYIGDAVPNGVLLVIMFFASVVAGAVWGLIPAVFKALWNTNETLFTLMMNYVATYLVAFALIKWTPDGSSTLGIVEHGHLPEIFHPYLLLIVIVGALTLGIYIYLYHSKQGYEISVVGESQKTACYIGINVKKVVIRTMVVSGAICGVMGFLYASALDHTITTATVGGLGFTAIMVSWLAKFNPFIMIATSALIVFLNQGSSQMSTAFNISSAFPNVIVGIILFFIIGCEFFINYRIKFRKSKGDAEK